MTTEETTNANTIRTIPLREGQVALRVINRDPLHASFVDVAAARYIMEPSAARDLQIPYGVTEATLGAGVVLLE
jgi:hypothetical protein